MYNLDIIIKNDLLQADLNIFFIKTASIFFKSSPTA